MVIFERIWFAALLTVAATTPQLSAFAQTPAEIAPTFDTPSEVHFEPRLLELFANQPLQPTDPSPWLASAPPGLIGESGNSETIRILPGTMESDRSPSLMRRMWGDQLNFYSRDSLLLIAGGMVVGATFANTRLDNDIHNHLQSSLHHANSDDWLESLHANKELGDGRFTLPVFAGAWVLGSLLPESEFGTRSKVWGERTLRAFVVGAPPVLLLQHVTGGSRPGEASTGSEWEPWRDNNGVSGHAFMGALPFITAAKMSDHVAWKATFYAASALAPLSRAADGAHYPSQVALGWGLAFVAATAVHATDVPNSRWHIIPTATATGSGMALEYRF